MNPKENEQFINCPECGKKIQLTQALMSHIEADLKKKYQEEYDNKIHAREKKVKADTEKAVSEKYETDIKDLENQVSEKDKRLKDLNKRELELNQKERDLAEKESNIQLKVDEQVRTRISAIEKKTKEDIEKIITEKFETDIKDLENQVSEKDKRIKELNKRELELNQKEKELDAKKLNLEKEYENKFNKAKETITAEAKQKAEDEVSVEFGYIKSQLDDYKQKYKYAQQQELELRKLKNQLEADREEFELQKQRDIDAAKAEIYQKVKSESEAGFKLQLRDKDLKLEQLTKQIDLLKAEKDSQQIQGESQELELEDILKHHFPLDEITPIAKGIRGADILQKVRNKYGYECGNILWESKRAKKFEPKWIDKLKEDQRNQKAHVAVIISQVLPENVINFSFDDGVYIGSLTSVLGIGYVLREQLLQIQMLRQSEVGKNQKMESLYNYLTSHEFAQRIEAILEAFEAMQKQIGDERKAYEKQWSAREKLLAQVIKNTAGMHGDLKGLIGASLPEIKALEMPEVEEEEIAAL